MGLVDKLKEEYGIESITPEEFDRFTNGESKKEDALADTLIEFPDELEKHGILVWTDLYCRYTDQHESLIDALTLHFGNDYEKYIAARQIIRCAEAKQRLESMQKVFNLLREHTITIKSGKEFAFDFGPSSEIIENGKHGILVKPKDPDALARAILMLLQDRKMRVQLGKAARQLAIKKFNWDNVIKKIDKVYDRALSKIIDN